MPDYRISPLSSPRTAPAFPDSVARFSSSAGRLNSRAQLSDWIAAGSEYEQRKEMISQIENWLALPPLQAEHTTLDLSGFRCVELPADLGSLIPHVQKLNLSNNHLTSLVGLEKLHDLKELIAEHNPLHDIDGLPRRIETLNLASTSIEFLGEALFHLENLRELDLSNSKITSLKGIPLSGHLRKLLVHSTSIPDVQDLSVARELQTLDISNTLIESLTGLASLEKLATLKINSIRLLSGNFTGIPHSLVSLEANDSGIHTLSGIEECGNLSELHVEENNLNHLDELKDLIAGPLRRLNAMGNNLTDIDWLAGRYGQMEYCWLDDPHITQTQDELMNSKISHFATMALEKWASVNLNKSAQHAEAFLRETISPEQFSQLYHLEGGRELLLFCARQPFSAACLNDDILQRVSIRLQENLRYILDHQANSALIAEINRVVEQSNNFCGDLVSHGEIVLNRRVMQHHIVTESRTGQEIFDRLLPLFNQERLEQYAFEKAAEIASTEKEVWNINDENIEFYLALAVKMKQKKPDISLDLVEEPSHISMFSNEADILVEEALLLMSTRPDQAEWKTWLADQFFTEELLQKAFTDSYNQMSMHYNALNLTDFDQTESLPTKIHQALIYAWRHSHQLPEFSQLSDETLYEQINNIKSEWIMEHISMMVEQPELLDAAFKAES